MINKRAIGSVYEDIAREYLIKHGYNVLCTNFYSWDGEIDIIAMDREYLCFIEVKYRDKNSICSGFEAVNSKKQKKIIKTSKFYLYKKNIDENKTLCRYDVISITGDKIELLKNAF